MTTKACPTLRRIQLPKIIRHAALGFLANSTASFPQWTQDKSLAYVFLPSVARAVCNDIVRFHPTLARTLHII